MADEESAKPGSAAEPNEAAEEPSKIHVDRDWKKEARAEKERLARDLGSGAPGTGGAGAAAEEAAGPPPEPDFAALVQQLAGQAALFLSDERDPRTGRPLRRLDLAKHTIDLLDVLEEKTKGNLTDEEQRLLDAILYELRMAYVEAS